MVRIARTHAGQGQKLAFLAGGETVVHLTGTRPGRAQPGAGPCRRTHASPGWMHAVFLGGQRRHRRPNRCCGRLRGRRARPPPWPPNRPEAVPAVLAEQRRLPRPARRWAGCIVTGPTGTNVNDVSRGADRKSRIEQSHREFSAKSGSGTDGAAAPQGTYGTDVPRDGPHRGPVCGV